jgi:phosphoribosylformylglycinamidine synthase
VDEVLAICRRGARSPPTSVEVTDTGRLVIDWRGDAVVDVPAGVARGRGPGLPPADGGARANLDVLQQSGPDRLPRPESGEEILATLLEMVASPNLCAAPG